MSKNETCPGCGAKLYAEYAASAEGRALYPCLVDVYGQPHYPTACEMESLRRQLAAREQQFGNVLAIIHHDGGQYITKHGWETACADAIEDVTTTRSALVAVTADRDRLKAVVERLRTATLSQCGWEDSEDIVLLNGKPIGMTITHNHREFDRWWPAVKAELLGEGAAEAAKEKP